MQENLKRKYEAKGKRKDKRENSTKLPPKHRQRRNSPGGQQLANTGGAGKMPQPNFKPSLISISFPLLLLLLLPSTVESIGVNWGTAASHPLPPSKVVELLKANSIGKVRLFDADPLILQSLSGSKIRVTVGIPNAMLRSLNASLKAAESWVHDNLTRFVSDGASRVLIE